MTRALVACAELVNKNELVFCTGSSGFADGRSETSPESESEVDGNEVKSTTGTSVKQIQDSSRSQLTI